MNDIDRRDFVKGLSAAGALTLAGCAIAEEGKKKAAWDISLAQWSLHRMLRGKKLTNMQFPEFTKKTFDVHAVEYVNSFFKDKPKDKKYLTELKKRTADNGIRNVLIMCDGLGRLGDPDEKRRLKTVDNHKAWVDAAKFLGCHSIRVNAASRGKYQDQLNLAADGLAKLSTYAATQGMNVIVENHGGLSSNGAWLAAVMKKVNMKNCGTLPDFGNFHSYDRYKGLTETMPFAKGVSAKSHEFNEKGEETRTDFTKAMKIVKAAGYKGYVGIEYEGRKHSEVEGIKLTKALLEKVFKDLA